MRERFSPQSQEEMGIPLGTKRLAGTLTVLCVCFFSIAPLLSQFIFVFLGVALLLSTHNLSSVSSVSVSASVSVISAVCVALCVSESLVSSCVFVFVF